MRHAAEHQLARGDRALGRELQAVGADRRIRRPDSASRPDWHRDLAESFVFAGSSGWKFAHVSTSGTYGGPAPNATSNEMTYQETCAVPPVGGPHSVELHAQLHGQRLLQRAQVDAVRHADETPIWAPYWKGSQEIRKSADAVSQACTLPSWKSTCIPPPPITHDGVSAK